MKKNNITVATMATINRTGKTFYMFRANMNNPELFELLMQWDYYSTIPDELKTAIY